MKYKFFFFLFVFQITSILKNITNELPSRESIVIALSNIAKFTRNEIKSQLAISSANYITFDQWSDPRNREYLGITIRSYIHGKYYDIHHHQMNI